MSRLINHSLLALLMISLFGCSETSSSSNADTDLDGVPDRIDAFPNDAEESADTDGDGVGDNSDVFPNDTLEQVDSDGDGVGDNSDLYPNNSFESQDSDGDGIGNNADIFPDDATERIDSDGDGIGDNSDNCFLLPNLQQNDKNQDGKGDLCSLNDTGAVLTAVNGGWLFEGDCVYANGVIIEQQDCFTGRDAANKSGELKKYGQGYNSKDFTKLDAQGNELSHEATSWACVRDNVTSNIWEIKNQVDNSNIHYIDNKFVANSDKNVNHNQCPFYDLGLEQFCTIEEFILRTNSEQLCGAASWALPRIKDVFSLLNFNRHSPDDSDLDNNYFPKFFPGHILLNEFVPTQFEILQNQVDKKRLVINGPYDFESNNVNENSVQLVAYPVSK